MVRNVVADLLIGLGRRVQSPLNRFLRQQLVCARCVREVLVVAGLCTGVNVSIDFERCNVAAGNACFRLHRHNIRVEIDERYGDAVVADTCFSVHAGGMDAVGLSAGRDLGNLAPVGRRMGELDQIVNAGLYRRGCPRIVFPADIPAQRVPGVQVVRRILLERLHEVCDREGHDPCGIILAFFKRILLPGNTRLCGILPLTAVHVVVAVLPEAVDAGDGNKAVECLEDIVAGRRFNHLADDFNDRQVTLLLPFPVPVNSCFGVIAEGDGQRCVLLVNEPMLGAGGLVICHQIRRYRDRRGDVVALIVHLHIADRILRRGGNIIRLVRMCCFVVLADDSKAAVQRRGLHRRLAAADIDGQRVLCVPLLAVVVESGIQLGIRVDQPVRTLRITLPRVISRSKLGRHRSRIDIPLFFDRVKRHSANSGAHAPRNREFAAMLCIRPARDLNISELCGRGLAGSFYACVNELNNSGSRLNHHPFAGQIFAVRVGFVIYPLERYINPFFRVLRGMSGILQSCVLRIEVQPAGISHTPIRTVAYIGECNHFIRMIATHADELDRVLFQLILAVARAAGSLGFAARFLPDGVQHLGAVELDPRLLSSCSAARVLRFCRVSCFGPANEVIAVSGGFSPINIKLLRRSSPVVGFVEKVICGAVVLVIRHRILDRRYVLFPDRIDGLGAVFMFNGNLVARLILRISRSRTVSPALEGVAFLGRDLIADGKGNLVHRWMRCRTRLTIRRTGAAIRIILQFKEWHPDGVDGLGWIVLGQCDRLSACVLRSRSIRLVRPANVLIATAVLQLRCINIKREGSRRRAMLTRLFCEPRTVRAVVILIIQIVHVGRSGVGFLRDQINRIRCLRSSRTGGVEVKNCGVLFGLFRPANEFIARIQLAFQRRNADISELADQNRMIEARMACAILACIGLINRRAIVIANVELIADIKNLVLDCLCFIRFQRLRTDTVVSR